MAIARRMFGVRVLAFAHHLEGPLLRAIVVSGLLSVSLVGVAEAADCDSPYSTDSLLSDLSAVEMAAQNNEQGMAIKVATQLEIGLGCLEEKLVPMLIGRTYRSIAAGYLVGGKEAKAKAWFRTAIEVDPGFSYGLEEFGLDSPVRQTYDSLQGGATSAVELAGRSFVEGKHYIDGRTMSAPSAVLGRPHLLQQKLESGVKSWVVTGNQFPEEVLTSDAPVQAANVKKDKPAKEPKAAKEPKPAKEPKEKKNKTVAADTPAAPAGDGSTYDRLRPPEKTPLIIAGGAVIAGAGAMYGLSIVQRKKFDDTTSSAADVRSAANATNRMFLASVAVLAVGGGTLTWGIMLDGPAPGAGLRMRW